MKSDGVRFEAFAPGHRARCLEVFDANCPESFAPNEREEYAAFLDDTPGGYEVCLVDGAVAGAFGLIEEAGRPGPGAEAPAGSGLRLHWILIDPAIQGRGVGTAMMTRVVEAARARIASGEAPDTSVRVVDIAASHRSAPFFARFGAEEVRRTEDGWGPGMHRVDMRLPV
jgi:GNAT superfamily N-acetyltransferase